MRSKRWKVSECKGDRQQLKEKRRKHEVDRLVVQAADKAKVPKDILDESKRARKFVRDLQRANGGGYCLSTIPRHQNDRRRRAADQSGKL